MVYGSKVGLGAQVDGQQGVVLQRRPGRWGARERNVTVDHAADAVLLSAGGVNGPVVAVAVAPKLKVRPAGPNVLSGTVSPVSAAS